MPLHDLYGTLAHACWNNNKAISHRCIIGSPNAPQQAQCFPPQPPLPPPPEHHQHRNCTANPRPHTQQPAYIRSGVRVCTWCALTQQITIQFRCKRTARVLCNIIVVSVVGVGVGVWHYVVWCDGCVWGCECVSMCLSARASVSSVRPRWARKYHRLAKPHPHHPASLDITQPAVDVRPASGLPRVPRNVAFRGCGHITSIGLGLSATVLRSQVGWQHCVIWTLDLINI